MNAPSSMHSLKCIPLEKLTSTTKIKRAATGGTEKTCFECSKIKMEKTENE